MLQCLRVLLHRVPRCSSNEIGFASDNEKIQRLVNGAGHAYLDFRRRAESVSMSVHPLIPSLEFSIERDRNTISLLLPEEIEND